MGASVAPCVLVADDQADVLHRFEPPQPGAFTGIADEVGCGQWGNPTAGKLIGAFRGQG